jgi:NADH:ubiquinone oxidoreductase subunit 6 (subunit J)
VYLGDFLEKYGCMNIPMEKPEVDLVRLGHQLWVEYGFLVEIISVVLLVTLIGVVHILNK